MASHITGFDIGESTIKMVYFSYGTIKKAICSEIPDNLVANGQILSMDAMADYILEISKDNKMPRKEAALVLPASQVVTRILTIPAMNEEQLEFNLPYEFKDYLSDEKDKYTFDYEVLETILDENGEAKEQRLFACAVLKEVITKYEKMFKRAGYNLTTVIPEDYAYSKYCRADTGIKTFSNSICAMIDIGHLATVVHILKKGEYDSKRTIDIGGKKLDEVIAIEKSLDIHIAHNNKLLNVDNVLYDEKCMAVYNTLAIEILKAINFFNYNNRDVDLKNLYLVGGGASIEPLRKVIQEVTNLNVDTIYALTDKPDKINNPWVYLKASSAAASVTKEQNKKEKAVKAPKEKSEKKEKKSLFSKKEDKSGKVNHDEAEF